MSTVSILLLLIFLPLLFFSLLSIPLQSTKTVLKLFLQSSKLFESLLLFRIPIRLYPSYLIFNLPINLKMSSRSSSFPSITTEDAELPHHDVAVYMLNNLPPASPPTIFLSDPPALQLPSSGIKPSAARANDKASSTSHHTSPRPIIVKRRPRVSIPAFEDDGDGSRTKQWLNSNIPRSLRRLAEAAKKRNFRTPSPLIEVPTAYQRPTPTPAARPSRFSAAKVRRSFSPPEAAGSASSNASTTSTDYGPSTLYQPRSLSRELSVKIKTEESDDGLDDPYFEARARMLAAISPLTVASESPAFHNTAIIDQLLEPLLSVPEFDRETGEVAYTSTEGGYDEPMPHDQSQIRWSASPSTSSSPSPPRGTSSPSGASTSSKHKRAHEESNPASEADDTSSSSSSPWRPSVPEFYPAMSPPGFGRRRFTYETTMAARAAHAAALADSPPPRGAPGSSSSCSSSPSTSSGSKRSRDEIAEDFDLDSDDSAPQSQRRRLSPTPSTTPSSPPTATTTTTVITSITSANQIQPPIHPSTATAAAAALQEELELERCLADLRRQNAELLIEIERRERRARLLADIEREQVVLRANRARLEKLKPVWRY